MKEDEDFIIYSRGLREEEYPKLREIMIRAFKMDPNSTHFDRFIKIKVPNYENIRVLLKKFKCRDDPNGINEIIIGGGCIFEFNAYFGKEILKIGGLGYISIDPQYQKRGYGRKLLEEINKYMLKNSFDVGLLYTPSPGFYDKLNWIMGFSKHLFYINIEKIKEQQQTENRLVIKEENFSICNFKEDYLNDIKDIYAEFNKQFPMTPIRKYNYWKSQFQMNRLFFENMRVIKQNKRVIGYFVVNLGSKYSENDIELVEYGHKIRDFSPKQREQIINIILQELIRLARQHNKKRIITPLPDNRPLIQYILRIGGVNSTGLLSDMMVKIINPPKFIEKFFKFQQDYIVPSLDMMDIDKNIDEFTLNLEVKKNFIEYKVQAGRIELKLKGQELQCNLKNVMNIIIIPLKYFAILSIGNMNFRDLFEINDDIIELSDNKISEKYINILNKLFPDLKVYIYKFDSF
ncbi:MAG: GNAT family N-acetyltransferase [Promethearchaeota archaeon]